MAKLKKRESSGGSNRNWDLSEHDNAVDGTFTGILLDVKDAEGIEEPSYDDPAVMVTHDKCRFLYAVKDEDDSTFLVQTFEMVNSSNERSNLIKHLTALRGKAPPVGDDDYDYCDEIGRKVSVTVQARTSSSGVEYGVVSAVTPLNKKLHGDAPSINTPIPGGRTSSIPDWISEEEEEVEKMDKVPKRKRATRSRKTKTTKAETDAEEIATASDAEEEDPF